MDSHKFLLSVLLIVSLANLVSSQSIYFEISPGRKVCFLEDVPGDTLISAEWSLTPTSEDADMAKAELILSVVLPNKDHNLFEKALPKTGRDEFGARQPGEYEICFLVRQPGWSRRATYKLNLDIESGAEAIDYDKLANSEDLSNLQVTLRHVSNQLRSLKKRQRYSRELAIEHSELSETTNDQIVYWSVIETLVLIGLSVYQVHYLKKFFKSKKVV